MPAAASSPVRLHLSLLGDIELRIEGQPAAGKVYGKMLALLAYLALESQRSHRREQLADLLWPQLPAEAARINLRQTLYHLRRMLRDSDARLITGRDAVRLNNAGDWWLDVRAFLAAASSAGNGAQSDHPQQIEQMEAAAALYRGDFLASLAVDDAAEFEGWRDGWRATLQQHMLRLLERLRDSHAQQGTTERALQHAQHHLALEPWNEAAHRAVMRLLAAAGRTAEALDQFENCQRLLAQELGTSPADATRQLAEALREDLLRREHSKVPAAMPAPSAAGQYGSVLTAAYAERRQVTILYCSLNASGSADAEEIAERLRLPYQLGTRLASQHGGHVLAAPGGSFIAYFGYPVASEDAARSAVRAARAIAAICRDGVQARSGIHSASIVTGSIAGQPDPAGVASALALRLCERAAGGEVHLSDSTRQLVSGYFYLQPCGSQALRSYRVAGATSASNRLDAAAQLQQLVGRTAEMAQLLALRDAASAGPAQQVVLRGEAGIGKSRLLRELAGTLAPARWQRLELQCEAAFHSTPWQPVIALLERLIGCQPDQPAASKRSMLSDYLASQHAALAASVTATLQTLLGIAEQPAAISSEALRQQTSAALLALFHSAAAQRPVLLAVEDLHWADPSTLALLAALARHTAALPVMTVYTVRNDSGLEPWLQENSTVLELQHLDDGAMTVLVGATGAALSAAAIARIVASAEGIPLFAEELAQQALEQPGARQLPATLAYLLAARLDTTGAARRLAQLAATIGRRFDLELLAHVGPVDNDHLQALQQARLLEQCDARHFEFRHALIHAAAYQSQTRADRQHAHRRVADALLQHYPQRASQQPAQLAHHLGEAADYPAALAWWLQAGRQALAAHACAEAAEHLRSGLAVLEQIPASAARADSECELLLALGQTLLALAGYGSAEAASVYDRAHALCSGEYAAQCDGARRFDVLWGLWMVSSSRAQASFRTSAALIPDLLQAASASGDWQRRGHAHAAAANLALWRGRFEAALEHARSAVQLCSGQPRPRDHQHGHDPQVAGLAYAAWAHLALGQHAAALEDCSAAIALARTLDHPDSLCFALVHAATVYRLRHDAATVATLADEILALAGQYQLALWQVAGTMLRGWCLAYAGQREGLALLEFAADAVRSVMPGILVAFLHPLAEALGFLHDYPAQLAQLDAALASAEQLDDQLHRASLLQLRAACLASLEHQA
ncbi:BTAD domain-containing putative transcriptional regulator [Duganella qianjiadongensis]|uniref:AAA family ATPase n=1 Tax=Duganella qianjiadongensis TaxID=2692176 RepID=A0ABW9VGI6_9BURK|nr:AAA family ATPase [Duganella qianjiadongensis]MYM38734.1 AAA family ATPase [Duganella qianjiadongensis]